MQPELDQDAVRLAKAIRYTESRDNPNAKGASGEFGLFQFMPDTWASTTRKYGLNPSDTSRQNQNKAAYLQIKELKDQGYKPDQIAGFWNSGKLTGWENNVGTNSKGVRFDTPDYVRKVGSVYQSLKGGGQAIPQTTQSTVMGGVPGLPPPPAMSQQNFSQGQEVAQTSQRGFLESVIKDPFESLANPAAHIGNLAGEYLLKGADFLSGGRLNEFSQRNSGKSIDENIQNYNAQTKALPGGLEVQPMARIGQGGGEQLVGEGLKAASYIYGGGAVPEIAGLSKAGAFGKLALHGLKVGGITGAMYGAGDAMQNQGDFQKVATEGVIGGALGGALGAGTAGLSGLIPIARNPQKYAEGLIRKDVDELLYNGRAMTNATNLLKEKNVPIADILVDPEIFKGIQVSDNKLNTEDAVAAVDDRIEAYMKAKRQLLPEFDRIVTPTDKSQIVQKAQEELSKAGTMHDTNNLLRELDAQLAPYPKYMKPSEIDDLRAAARQSSRNARGLQKDSNVYSAIENAARDTLFDTTKNLPVEGGGSFAELHNEVKNLIATKDFLEKTLPGRNAPRAGWAREAVARMVGGAMGAAHGNPLSVFVGQEMGARLQHIIANKRLGNSMKMKLVKGMTKDNRVISEVEKLLKNAKGYDPVKERLALSAPSQINLGPHVPKQEAPRAVPAAKGEPGRVPKGKPGAGRYFKTFMSSEGVMTPPRTAEKISAENSVTAAFDRSTNQKKVGNFVLGSFGENAFARKAAQRDRFPINELEETQKYIKNAYKASADSGNYRSGNIAWVAEMPNGEKRVIYTRKNASGQEEIINAHTISDSKYEDTLKKFGVPAETRTRIIPLERDGSDPLNYRDKSNITPPDRGVNAVVPIGGAAGIEQDDQGNTTIDPKKALAGMAIVGLATRGRGVPKLTAEMKTNLVKAIDDYFTKGGKNLDTELQQDLVKMAEDLGIDMPKQYGALVKKMANIVEANDNGMKVLPQKEARFTKGEGGKFTGSKGLVKPFKNFEDLSTKLLGKLEGKTTVSKQYISDLTNQPELKQPERDLFRKMLEGEGDTVNVKEFANKVKSELLPLKAYKLSPPQYERVNLPNETRGNVADYSEHIYNSPIETSAGNVHFGQYGTSKKNYFAHTRTEDLAATNDLGKPLGIVQRGGESVKDFKERVKSTRTTRRVIEVQSDLFQKGRLEQEQKGIMHLTPAERKRYDYLLERQHSHGDDFATYKKEQREINDILEKATNERRADTSKLEPYRNTWHERVIREELKKAAKDGVEKVRFPTGETAMKIEGLGGGNSTWRNVNGHVAMPEDISVGKIMQQGEGDFGGGDNWLVTENLGDGKFKAISDLELQNNELAYRYLQQIGKDDDGRFPGLDELGDVLSKSEMDGLIKVVRTYRGVEQFDVSGKVDTENPIYKFYEKEVGKYLKNKFGAQLVTDDNGVSWWEVGVDKKTGKLPVEAFGIAPLVALPSRKKEKDD